MPRLIEQEQQEIIRYRAADDPRCRKVGGTWECPAEVWEEWA